MMWLAVFIFVVSILALLGLLYRHKLARSWLNIMMINMVVAAVVIYLWNNWSVVAAYPVSINLLTLSTSMILGIPGVGLVIGLSVLV